MCRILQSDIFLSFCSCSQIYCQKTAKFIVKNEPYRTQKNNRYHLHSD